MRLWTDIFLDSDIVRSTLQKHYNRASDAGQKDRWNMLKIKLNEANKSELEQGIID